MTDLTKKQDQEAAKRLVALKTKPMTSQWWWDYLGPSGFESLHISLSKIWECRCLRLRTPGCKSSGRSGSGKYLLGHLGIGHSPRPSDTKHPLDLLDLITDHNRQTIPFLSLSTQDWTCLQDYLDHIWYLTKWLLNTTPIGLLLMLDQPVSILPKNLDKLPFTSKFRL